MLCFGYYNNEEETKKVLQNGWFKTGDYGYLDEDEFLYVTGRKKDVIVLKNGKNVYPQEIEFLINKIPYVKESLVYQREQSTTDTMLCAKIVYDENIIKESLGEKAEEEYKEIIWKEVKEINKILPIHKYVKNITITTKELSKTTTQKVKRFEEIKKIMKISGYRDQIVLLNQDAKELLQPQQLRRYYKSFINLDPPYVKKGTQLYKNAFIEKDHRDLCKLISECNRKWVVTYDICPLVAELYKKYRSSYLDVTYSIQISKKAQEYIFFSDNLQLPNSISLR